MLQTQNKTRNAYTTFAFCGTIYGMDDTKRDKLTAKGAAHLLRATAISGVAVLGMRDGHIYMFSSEFLRKMLQTAEESSDDAVLVFVKRGPDADSVPDDVVS